MFVRETENVLGSRDVGKDLISLTRLQQKHKVCCMWKKSNSSKTTYLKSIFITGLIPHCLYGCTKFHGNKSHVDFIYGSFNRELFTFIKCLR